MPVLYIRDVNGDFVPVKALRGKPGKTPVRGKDYWTDADQQQIVQDVLSQMGGTGGGDCTLPIATPDTLGGVKPVAKTDAMTQPVGVDAAGALFTAPGGGGEAASGGTISSIECIYTVTEADVAAGTIDINLGTIGEKTIYRLGVIYFDEGKGGGSVLKEINMILPKPSLNVNRKVLMFTGNKTINSWQRHTSENVLIHTGSTMYMAYDSDSRINLQPNKAYADPSIYQTGDMYINIKGTFVAGVNIYIRAEVLD